MPPPHDAGHPHAVTPPTRRHPPPEADVPTSLAFRLGGLALGPGLFLAVLLGADLGAPKRTATAAVAVLMATWWITEALPLAITALLPLVLFPALGVQPAKDVAPAYTNSIVFLFIGGFLVALCMEKWNLHRRIALGILARSGARPAGVLAGFMIATAFLSMWISNTATAMMMLPIGLAILVKWEELRGGSPRRAFAIALMLGIPYAASIGGVATLVGTPPNMSLAGIHAQSFPDAPRIEFARWMLYATPLALVFLVATWAFLAWRMRGADEDRGAPPLDTSMVREELRRLGPMTRPEGLTLAVFVGVAIAWITRAPLQLPGVTLPGWSTLLPAPKMVDDGTVAIAAAVLLFLLPSGHKPGERLLDGAILPKLPWGIVLLFGGGFALADGFQASGLSLWVGENLKLFAGLPTWALIALVCLVITFLTEVTSNTASAQILLPLLAALAIELDIDPLLLMAPGAISCSCAFMLPVATPPNAIAVGTDRLRMGDMVRAGVWLNLLGVALVTVSTLTIGRWALGM